MNLHPALAHFPIALLVATFVIEILALLLKRPQIRTAAFLTLVLAAGGAAGAYVSGSEEGEAVEHQVGIPEDGMEIHENLGTAALILSIALLVLRLVSMLQTKVPWLSRGSTPVVVNGFYAILLLAAVGVVLAAGYFGGRLVYEHGAGVKVPRVVEHQEKN